MKLFDFAFCPSFIKKIDYLAALAEEEAWNFDPLSERKPILENYIHETFKRAYKEDKIVYKAENAFFNTGLYTKEFFEPIYACFNKNQGNAQQEWLLSSFLTIYTMQSLQLDKLPERVQYFSNPSDIFLDTKCEIIPQYNHIFKDEKNKKRLPEEIRNSLSRSTLFDGAIKRAKARICGNYQLAVPQYYNDNIQLLIPICLLNPNVPDLAMPISKEETGNRYIASTCLTLEMAYSNARLIAKQEASWIFKKSI